MNTKRLAQVVAVAALAMLVLGGALWLLTATPPGSLSTLPDSEFSTFDLARLHGQAAPPPASMAWLWAAAIGGVGLAGLSFIRYRQKTLPVTLSVGGGLAVLIGLGLVFLATGTPVGAESDFPDELPNGLAIYNSISPSCGLCHGYSGSTRLSSSTAGYLAALLKPYSTNTAWGGHGGSSTAVTTDVDGDGFTSGEELQDPTGAWVYNGSDNTFNDTAYVSAPNDSADFPPAPQVTDIIGLADGQTISNSVTISAALRYAGLARVVFSLADAGGAEVYSSTVAYPSTDYTDPYCMGSSAGSCSTWNTALVANGTYTLTVTAVDKLSSGLGGPQTGSLARLGVVIDNKIDAANLTITQRDSHDPARIGLPLTYTIAITNFGPDPATGVVVTDVLPSGVSLATAVISGGSACTDSGGEVHCAVGAVPTDTTVSIAVVVTPTTTGTKTNVALVSATEVDPEPATNRYTETTTVTTPDLALGKRASAEQILLGQPITYSLTVTNAGPGPAPAVTLQDDLPSGVQFGFAVPGGPTCTESGGVVTCNFGDLPAGQSVTATVFVTPTMRGVITNTASVTSSLSDEHPADNTDLAVTVVGMIDMRIGQSDSPDPVGVGQPLTYTIAITNGSLETASTLRLTDTLPASSTLLGFDAPGASCIALGDSLLCALPDVPPGDSIRLSVTVQLSQTGRITNTVQVGSTQPDPTLSNNRSAEGSTVTTPDLSVTKQASVLLAFIGQPLTYTLTVANHGPGPATGIVLTDTLPANTVPLTWPTTSPACAVISGDVTCALPDLADGGQTEFAISVVPTAAAVITNTASVASARPDSAPDDNTATVKTVVEAEREWPYIYSGSKDDNLLRIVNPQDGTTVATVFITMTGETVQQVNGLATNPATGELWALLKLHGQTTRRLSIIDPVTGVATSVGDTGPGRVSTLAFDGTGDTLYGITGDGSPFEPETLFTLSMTNAALSMVMPLGNGNEGEAIAFNPIDGLMYHVSGYGPQNDPSKGEIFETIDLNLLTTTNVALWGDDYFGSNALIYLGDNQFFMADCGRGGHDACASPWFSQLFRLSADGTSIFFAQLDHLSKGLAVGADVRLAVDAGSTVRVNEPLTYTIGLTNAGYLDAKNVQVRGDVAPGGAQLAPGAGGACVWDSTVFTCTIASLPNGDHTAFDLVVTPTVTGTLAVSMTATSHAPDPNQANNVVSRTTTVSLVDVSVQNQASSGALIFGRPLTYTVTVQNHGPGSATGVVLTHSLSLSATVLETNPGSPECAGGAAGVVCQIGTLSEGGSFGVTIIVSPTVTGTLVSTATVHATEAEASLANNVAAATTEVSRVQQVYLPLILRAN